jgi:hypothetical protein
MTQRAVSRLGCCSPGVFLAVLGAGVVVVAPHWRGLYTVLKIVFDVAIAISIGTLGGWSIVKLGEWSGDRWSRREAARLAGVSAAYAAQLSASACKWSRPESAAGRAQSDLSDAASRRAMSAPSRWQEQSAPFRAPADVPAAGFCPLADYACTDGPSPVLERSRAAMAESEALLEQAGVTWRSPAARQVNEQNWARVPAERDWRDGARSNASRGPRQAAGPAPATDPITGAPIHYDEAP